MGSFLKIPWAIMLGVAHMDEWDAARERPDDGRDIVLRVGRERAGA